jgi:aspartate racemase
MGALASADFARTIYECNPTENEQDGPIVIIFSDPTMPDRTEAFFNGSTSVLVDRLVEQLMALKHLGVDKIVLCCVTLHYTLPHIPTELRTSIVSLIDVALAQVIDRRQRQLLLCSAGTRAAAIFESHDLWREASEYIVRLDEHDQKLIHEWLYRYKKPGDIEKIAPEIETLLTRYDAESFIAGCTELHLFTRSLRETSPAMKFVDPLITIAERFVPEQKVAAV